MNRFGEVMQKIKMLRGEVEEICREEFGEGGYFSTFSKDFNELERLVQKLWQETPNCDDCEERMPDEPMRDESRG